MGEQQKRLEQSDQTFNLSTPDVNLSDEISVDAAASNHTVGETASEASTMPEGINRWSFDADVVGSNPDELPNASSMHNKQVWTAAMTFLYIC